MDIAPLALFLPSLSHSQACYAMPKTAKYSLAVRGEQSIAYGEELRRSCRKYKKCKNIGFLTRPQEIMHSKMHGYL